MPNRFTTHPQTESVHGTEVRQVVRKDHVPASASGKRSKQRHTMQEQLMALRNGHTNFDQFGRSTTSDWERIAGSLMRKWQCPPGVGVEDVMQELMLAAWKFVDKWDPKYGVKIDRYVTWNAIDKAKKWINKQRQAGTAGDKGKSRYPYCFAALGGDDVALHKLSSLDSPEEHCFAHQRGLIFSRELVEQNRISPEDKAWILMFGQCGWDPDQAAVEVFGDFHARQFFQLESFETARLAAHQAMDVATRVAFRRELILD